MLDSETKKNIDEARNILVGKLPNPISQVEQITISLIYKFMSDMDREAVEVFKGKPKFFTGDHKKYDWKNLFDPKLGGHDILKLYGEGIEAMNTNPNIPALFREVFKNAYLPYRDPETLKMFLKVINKFSYDHSERLGDAYEYLLSVLGMQGDAGQFRTQRHIIDFMVKCVEPTKSDTICDPACGTAGFVISAYKYIRDSNTDDKGKLKLSPDERKRLANSLYGYDIDPTMVRFALVNMYLHGFLSPHIYEYDTLTSEEKWDERFDVILANPPFMSPSGGIRPHKRFSIQASKSEVLFTDYIHEHINDKGRAGIIVPNGIVATTQTAYRELRTTLVKESLLAVVSLPAGVFNPYSGVKTSILLLDKKLAKQTNKILFVKIENDGYDLGAQRREIDKNDLPDAIGVVLAFKKMLNKEITDNKMSKQLEKTKLGILVEKEKILANKDVVLSAERYVEFDGSPYTKIPTPKLGDIATFEYGYTTSAKDKGGVRFIRITDINEYYQLREEDPKYVDLNIENKKYLVEVGDILVARTGATYGKTVLIEKDIKAIFASYLIRIKFDHTLLLPKFFWHFTQTDIYWDQAKNLVSGGGQPQFNSNVIKEINIPLPPIEVQRAIVAEIEGFQKIIDGARQVIENYKPRILVNPKWERTELQNICVIQSGGTPSRDKKEYWDGGDIPWVGSTVCKDEPIYSAKECITKAGFENSNTKLFPIGTTLVALVGATIGKTAYLEFETTTNQNIAGLRPKDETVLNKKYLYYATQTLYNQFYKLGDSSFKMASLGFIKELKIPLPSIDEQISLVTLLDKEKSIIEANKTLIEIFEGKIKTKISEVWGDAS